MSKRNLPIIIILAIWTIESLLSFNIVQKSPDRLDSFFSFFIVATVYGIVMITLVLILMRWTNEHLSELVFSSETGRWRQILIGIILGSILFLTALFLFQPLSESIIGSEVADKSNLGEYFSGYKYLPFWIFLCVFKGGLSEELWRTYALQTFEDRYGIGGVLIALLLSSAVFGFGHYYQGTAAVLSTAMEGCVYAIIFFWRRSALEVIIAHATRDLITVGMSYSVFLGHSTH